MTPREFLDQIVMPNLNEYRAEYSDLRRAINATAAVHALPAHIFHWLEKNSAGTLPLTGDDQYRLQLASAHPQFKLVHDVALGIKHVSLTKPSASIDGASSLAVNTVGYGMGGYGTGRYGGREQIIVTLKDGSEKMLEDALEQTITMLEAEMSRFGL